MAKWTKVGSILKSKKGGSYIKVENDMKLTKGQFLSVFNPRKRPGISPEDLAKIPDFVVADVLLASEEK